jgi:predicted Zn-dependent protease
MRPRILLLIVLAAVTVSMPGVRAQQSPLVLAMQDEMKRSMSDLRMKDAPAPYYIAYEVQDRTVTDVSGRLGALVENAPRRMRVLRVEVRVGDYAFDSSRFVSQGFGGGALNGETALVALDDDYDAIRRDIWMTTDTAYKRAVTVFARKRAAFQNRSSADPLPDFSRETPVELQLPATAAGAGRDMAIRVQEPSAALGANAEIDASEVAISEVHGTRYFLNSEGFRTVAPIQLASLTMYAEAQAPDGMPVRETFSTAESSLQDLPSTAELVTRARALSARVAAERNAPVGEEFTGPVLLEGPGAAQFIAETLLPLVAARRSPDTDNPRMAQGFAPATPFLSRTGLRVMADSFSASDTPSLTQFNGKPVAGAYVVDDEGVRARDVTLVDKGRLVTLLTSRTPQKNFPQSNGHGRANGAWAGVFQLDSAQAIGSAELKAKYLALLKAQEKTFGYIVRDVRPASGGAGAGPGIDQVVRVTLDGREEPVRGLRFGTVPSTAFRDVSEASQERALYNYRGGLTSAVSVISPSLIFEELEIQRTRDILQKPPIVPSPLK